VGPVFNRPSGAWGASRPVENRPHIRPQNPFPILKYSKHLRPPPTAPIVLYAAPVFRYNNNLDGRTSQPAGNRRKMFSGRELLEVPGLPDFVGRETTRTMHRSALTFARFFNVAENRAALLAVSQACRCNRLAPTSAAAIPPRSCTLVFHHHEMGATGEAIKTRNAGPERFILTRSASEGEPRLRFGLVWDESHSAGSTGAVP